MRWLTQAFLAVFLLLEVSRGVCCAEEVENSSCAKACPVTCCKLASCSDREVIKRLCRFLIACAHPHECLKACEEANANPENCPEVGPQPEEPTSGNCSGSEPQPEEPRSENCTEGLQPDVPEPEISPVDEPEPEEPTSENCSESEPQPVEPCPEIHGSQPNDPELEVCPVDGPEPEEPNPANYPVDGPEPEEPNPANCPVDGPEPDFPDPESCDPEDDVPIPVDPVPKRCPGGYEPESPQVGSCKAEDRGPGEPRSQTSPENANTYAGPYRPPCCRPCIRYCKKAGDDQKGDTQPICAENEECIVCESPRKNKCAVDGSKNKINNAGSNMEKEDPSAEPSNMIPKKPCPPCKWCNPGCIPYYVNLGRAVSPFANISLKNIRNAGPSYAPEGEPVVFNECF